MFLFRYKIIKLFSAFLLCYSGTGCSKAQAKQSATATGTASASIIKPLTAHHLQTLRFGLLRPGLNGGSVRINPRTNQRRFLGTVRPIASGYDRYGCAVFLVNGEQGRQYEIVLPEEVDIESLFHNGQMLKARNFRAYSKNKMKIGNLGLLNTNGKDSFYVGGELFMNSDSLFGYYATKINVIVTYQ